MKSEQIPLLTVSRALIAIISLLTFSLTFFSYSSQDIQMSKIEIESLYSPRIQDDKLHFWLLVMNKNFYQFLLADVIYEYNEKLHFPATDFPQTVIRINSGTDLEVLFKIPNGISPVGPYLLTFSLYNEEGQLTLHSCTIS